MGFFKWLTGQPSEEEQVTVEDVTRIHLACLTNQGRRRPSNEDNFSFDGMVMPRWHLTMEGALTMSCLLRDHFRVGLFDGMGGESAGELASYVAAESFTELAGDGVWSEEETVAMLREINARVLAAAEKEKVRQMGSTAIIAQWNEKDGLLVNLGDSPAYLFRDGSMELLTKAHNNAEMLREAGITGRKAGLTQFLGLPEEYGEVVPHVVKLEPLRGDIYLLCSDGLTDMVPEGEIAAELMKLQDRQEAAPGKEAANVRKTAEDLCEKALEAGGKDNITIILAQIL